MEIIILDLGFEENEPSCEGRDIYKEKIKPSSSDNNPAAIC